MIAPLCPSGAAWRLAFFILLSLVFRTEPAAAQDTTPPAQAMPGTVATNSQGYDVQGYVIEGRTVPATNVLVRLFSKYSGTNVSLENIIQAASDLESEYVREGYPSMNIVIAPKRIKDGIVTMDVFPGALAQIVVAGNRYAYSTNGVVAEVAPPAETAAPPEKVPVPTPNKATNAGPRFVVQKYQIIGNTLLSPGILARTLTNTPGIYGTNVTLDGVVAARTAVKNAYFVRGYVTVDVGLPPQKLTNEMVKLQVTEGRLSAINVVGNHYYSSNNIMNALPGLRTNMILNGIAFQEEVNRANANQDRQIYSLLQPGPDPGTSDLILKIKDRLPLHAKIELNNQNSPGTPDLRVNSSLVYNNLWNLNHTLGVQYSFSPEQYKNGNQWSIYDKPLVANYSAFYRIPLGSPDSVEEVIESNPGSFGYNEATRKFNLPPASGQPELNIFASRSTIDTGLNALNHKLLFQTNTVNADGTIVTNTSLSTDLDQEDVTVNNDIGFRLTLPLPSSSVNFHSSLSGGMDFKTYEEASRATNNFFLDVTETIFVTPPVSVPVNSVDHSPKPYTQKELEYLPLSLRYDAGWRDAWGSASMGMGISANPWFSSVSSTISGGTNNVFHRGADSIRFITGSSESSGHWVTLTPTFYHDFMFVTNWLTMFRADGQWASEPLISNEQFGAGGVNSVRGYHEGESFGDTGWHASLEQQTPPYRVGTVYGNNLLIVRGSVYMDYANTYLLDPQGRAGTTQLWGTGVGLAASIGSHWEGRFLFSIPLISTAITPADEPYFNFSLTAQF